MKTTGGEREEDLQLWIGLVEFRPVDPKSYGAAGAFTTIVTWAPDPDGFRAKCEIIAKSLNLWVADIDASEPLAERMKKITLSEEMEDMIFRAERNPNAIVYGTFHRYRFDQA